MSNAQAESVFMWSGAGVRWLVTMTGRRLGPRVFKRFKRKVKAAKTMQEVFGIFSEWEKSHSVAFGLVPSTSPLFFEMATQHKIAA